jgi:hypothetical protein
VEDFAIIYKHHAKPSNSWHRQEPWVTAQANWPKLFYQALSDLLHGKFANPSAQISMFEWGGWCGTGSDSLYTSKNRALFMAFLRERRFSEALAQVFSTVVERSNFSLRPSFTENQWQRRFIEMCGQNWEVLYTGAATETTYGNAQALHQLASHGSDLSASYMVQMQAISHLRMSRDYLIAISLMIIPAHLPTPQKDGITFLQSGSTFELQRAAQPVIRADMQLQLLQILHETIQPMASLEAVETRE